MVKKALTIILSLCLVMTMFSITPAHAAASISLNKTEYKVSEKGQATITGLISGDDTDSIWIGIAPEGERLENTELSCYYDELPSSNIFDFETPNKVGKYEVRLLDYNYNLFAKASFTVVAPMAGSEDITLSKTELKLYEPMSVTVKGLTKEQMENGAWLGIAKWDEKIENTLTECYIQDLPVDNTYKFKAPYKFGKYEIRVFSDYDYSLFGKAEFLVVSSKAKPGDILLSKTSVNPGEKMSVTVKGLTPGELESGAWIGIAESGERLQNTLIGAYISDLPVTNIYEFTAPDRTGKYEVRVFCSSDMKDEEYEYGTFGKAEFIVGGAPVEEISAGYEGLASWAASEVNQAKNEGLVTNKVMANFPEDITREEFCELAILLYEKMTATKAVPVSSNPFSDTTNPEILKAYGLKIVNGIGDGKFAPSNKVTRQEISAMLFRTIKIAIPTLDTKAEFKTNFNDKNEIASWALDAVKFMNANDIVKGSVLDNGTSYIRPKGNTTKQEAILLVLRIFNKFDEM